MWRDVTEVTHLPRQDPLPIKQKLQVEALPVTVAPEVTIARVGKIYEGAYKRRCTLRCEPHVFSCAGALETRFRIRVRAFACPASRALTIAFDGTRTLLFCKFIFLHDNKAEVLAADA